MTWQFLLLFLLEYPPPCPYPRPPHPAQKIEEKQIIHKKTRGIQTPTASHGILILSTKLLFISKHNKTGQ
jgi:hypothetical protein